MATQVQHREQYDALGGLVRTWDRRLRWQQAATWLPRSWLPGLILGIVLAAAAHLTPWLVLSSAQIARIAAGALAAGTAAMLLTVWLWPRPPIRAARRFDRILQLQERVSTALELLEGRITADGNLTIRQVNDAFTRAQAVKIATSLPFTLSRLDWGIAAAFALALAGLLLLGDDRPAEQRSTAQQVAIDQAADDVADVIEAIASDPNLDVETRNNLLEPLQANLETLRDENISAEEAVATLNDIQALLEQQAFQMQERADELQASLQTALETLRQRDSDAGSPPPPESASPGTEAADEIDEIAESLPAQDPDELAATADLLEQAAEALESTSPEAAQALREAAQALRQNDVAVAQQNLDAAAQALREAQSEQDATESSGQQLNEQAQEMQQGAATVARAQSRTQTPSGQQGFQEAEEGGQPSQQQGEGGQEAGQQTQGGDDEGLNAGGQGNPQANSESPQSQDNAGTGPEGQGDASQAGNSPGSMSGDTTGAEPNPIDASQNQGAGQESQYEEVFAPRSVGSENTGEDIVLNANPDDTDTQEGDFSENPEGSATVPYNQVFQDYANAASEAMERGYVPLNRRDIVRDYFTNLDPANNRQDRSR